MSNYPNAYDDDASLPAVNDNIDQIGGDAINALRDAVVQIETALGLNIAGTQPTLAARLGVSINPDGTLNPAVFAMLPQLNGIVNSQIAPTAAIQESKLALDHSTIDLYNYITSLSVGVNDALGWIAVSGIKLEPHLIGAIYRHDLAQIDVAEVSSQYLNNVFRVARDNSDSYALISDINNELLDHQWADGTNFGIIQDIITNGGAFYPSNYAHVASGIYLDTSRFVVIPQTAQSVQAFADFIDATSILTLGTRVQNLYANGISRNSRSSSLTKDGYGSPIVPLTPAIAFLRGTGNSSFPVDDIAIGDDIIQFQPSALAMSNNTFDEQFALVQPGDIIRVNYTGDGYNVVVPFVVSEKKYIQGGGNKTYIIRIAGKNIVYSPHATARIDRALANNNKYGVLSTASGIPIGTGGNSLLGAVVPGLIIGSPRGAQCTGVGFSPDQFNESHYNLYLALYPDGNPLDGYTFLPAIDVTGNAGTTPGSYTLDSIIAATNNAFRQPGFNYRFIAFEFGGEFGIMLADSYNNASFSVVSAIISPLGVPDQTATQFNFPQNVIDVFPSTATDPLGFGPSAANLASPPFMTSYGSPQAANFPTFLFTPLKRNNYYVNGNELETMNLDVSQSLDIYGDGYWAGFIDGYSPNAGPPGHTTVTYNIPLDLSASGLKAGKTVVIQPLGSNNFGLVNYGRFVIQNVTFTCCPPVETQITVFDGVHAIGSSPHSIAAINSPVAIYFDSSSVSFDEETATDFSPVAVPFKRHFEVYIDQNSDTFTHERGRFTLTGVNTVINGVTVFNSSPVFAQMDVVSISPKLRGYTFGPVTKIALQLSVDSVGVTYIANLATTSDGITFTNFGPNITGKIGEVTRVYDETNIDYIDIFFSSSATLSPSSSPFIDIQLFPSLALDEEIMIIASCQENTSTNTVSQIKDLRQFGNTSEEELTTSALNYIAAPTRLLNFNGIVRGFDNSGGAPAYGYGAIMSLTGGLALVNGMFQAIDNQNFIIPPLQEVYVSTTYPINYAICVNSSEDLVGIVLTDYDPVFGTPNAPDRVVTVFNPVSSTTYTVDSCTFSYLLNNRKDLTPLYVVSSTVTGTGTGTSTFISNIRDVRRHAKDTDSSIPAVLTDDNSQGNFIDFAASINWLELNSTYQNTLYVKSATVVNKTIHFSPTPLNIIGGGNAASILFGSPGHPPVISNVNFTAVNLTFSNVPLISFSTFNNLSCTFNLGTALTDVTFNNCTVTFEAGATLINTTFNNCTVNFVGGTFTTFDVTLDNCTVTQSVTIIRGTGITMLNCQVTVNTTKAFEIGDNYTFKGTAFTWTVPTDGSFVSNDLINVGNAMFHTSLGVGASISNLIVRDCVFNVTLSSSALRYGFFSFQFTDVSAYVQGIDISKNQFLTTLPSGFDDIRAIISFTSMLAVNPPSQVTTNTVKNPFMFDVKIEDNFCNQNQMIAISSVRFNTGGFNYIVGPLLSAINCEISGNTCGTISFIVASTLPYDGPNSGVGGLIRNKADGLIIKENTCKFITNLDNLGQYITYRLTYPDNGGNASRHDLVIISTGPALISHNIANWIQVGAGGYGEYYNGTSGTPVSTYDGITITSNKLSPANPAFLLNFQDTGNGLPMPPGNYPITLRRESNANSGCRSIIANNTIAQKSLQNSSGGTTNTYYYDQGILCMSSASITGNTIIGCVNNSTDPNAALLTLTGTNTIDAIGNLFERAGQTINSYVYQPPPAGTNSTNIVNIVDNIFDSQFVDAANTIENPGNNIPFNWNFTRNKNQVGYASLDPADFNWTSAGLASKIFFNNAAIGGTAVTGWAIIISGPVSSVNINAQLDPIIPTGSKLMYAVMGANVYSGSGSNNFQFSILKGNTNTFSISGPPGSFAGSIVDLGSNGGNFSTVVGTSPLTTISAGSGGTNYTWLDTSGDNIFGGNNTTTEIFLALNVASGQIQLSPLLLKYKW